MIQIKPLKDDHQIASSYSVMKQLRPHLQGDTYLQQIRRLGARIRLSFGGCPGSK